MRPLLRAAISALSTAELEQRLARAAERPPIRSPAREYVAALEDELSIRSLWAGYRAHGRFPDVRLPEEES